MEGMELKGGWYHLMYPRFTLLVSAGTDKPNAMTTVWSTPLSRNPPLVGVAISEKRYTYDLIEENQAFGVNIPSHSLLDESFYLGTKTGKNVDKIKKCGLTILEGEKLGVPLIKECIAAFECGLKKKIETGDHDFFIGKVKSIYAEKDKLEDGWLKPEIPIYWRKSDLKNDVYRLDK